MFDYPVTLTRRLGWHTPQVDRLFDLRHASRLDQIEAAAAVLGRHLEVEGDLSFDHEN